MADQDWCLDGSTLVEPSGEVLGDFAKNFDKIIEDYRAQFRDYHTNDVTSEEWNNIIESTGVREYGFTEFDSKPDFEKLINWEHIIADEAASGWFARDKFREKFPDVKVNLFAPQVQKAKDFKTLDETLAEQFYLFGDLRNAYVELKQEEGDPYDIFINNYDSLDQKYVSGQASIDYLVEKYYELNKQFGDVLSHWEGGDKSEPNPGEIRDLAGKTRSPAQIDGSLNKLDTLLTKVKLCPDKKKIAAEYLAEIGKIGIIEDDDIDKRVAELEAQLDPTSEAYIDAPKAQEEIEALKAKKKKKADALKAALDAVAADEIIYREQCFLLANLAELVKFKKELSGSLNLPYDGSTFVHTSAPPSSAAFSVDTEMVVNGNGFNSPIHIQGDSFGFTNKLAVSPYQRALFDLKEHELSLLTPHMRFFKVDSGNNGKDISTEFTFDTNVTKDLKNYMNRRADKKGGRGLGVGVKSFNFSYDGSDPFSAKKAISAKLSIYAPSFSDLLEERRSPEGRMFRYVDLALKTGRYKSNDEATEEALKNKDSLRDIERENLDKLNFRLQVLVELASQNTTLRKLSEDKKNAIYESAITLYLTPTIHEFDFDDAGGVTFTINYLAYVEDYFSNLQFDIFGSMTADKKAREMTYDFFRQSGCDLAGIDFAQFKLADELYVSNMNSGALQSILKLMQDKDKIYYISIPKDDIRKWLSNPIDNGYIVEPKATGETSLSETAVDAAVGAATAGARAAGGNFDQIQYRLSLVTNNDLVENTAYFYLSDLIQAVMSNVEISLGKSRDILETNYMKKILDGTIEKTEPIQDYIEKRLSAKKNPKSLAALTQFEKLRIVLGPMEVTPYGKNSINDRAISCTIGDIPISLTYFLDFMSEKVLSKDFMQYPLSKFIKDIISDCLKNFINADGCFATNASQKVSLNSTTVLGYNTMSQGNGKDDLTNLILTQPDSSSQNCLLLNNVPSINFPILKISGPFGPQKKRSIDEMINYYIFSIGRRYPVDAYRGNVKDDADNGIFHYVLGDNKGIVKSISLDKTSTPGLKELRFEQEGFDGLEQLREVYNANITTFINPQTFPGTYLYVEPRGFDPTTTEDLTRFGIGGYYMITKTSHEITPGNAETSINAAWVASKGGKIIKDDGTPGSTDKRNVEGPDEGQKKCRVQALQNSVNVRRS